MVTWEQKSVKYRGRDRRVKQGGNRDEWRRVRDGMEIGVLEKGTRGVMEKGWNGMELSESISNPVSNTS